MKELTATLAVLPVLAALASTPLTAQGVGAPPGSWPTWRGFGQAGHSPETGLVEEIELDGEGHLWSYPLRGRGTPVIHGGRVFGMGYEGVGPDLQEVLFCLDQSDGSLIWELRFNDFLSDAVYDRYAITSPVVDVETGNVFYLTTPGLLGCVSPDGEQLWEHSLMSEFGRLTFPNSRTGAPIIDGELVITHSITSHWGPEGPARDRVYAFQKDSGLHVWTSTPGEMPVDNSLANPVFDWVGGRRVFYFTTGCGNLACIDARSGEPLWTYKMCTGGMNSSVVLHGENVIAIHGVENTDSSTIGRMVAVKRGAEPAPGQAGPVVLGREQEVWRNELAAFSSSPVIVGERIYQTTQTGDLACVDAETGTVLWHEKLGADQLHASPIAADGKLYVPLNSGAFFIVRPSDEGPEVLCEVQLEGNCLGAPAIAAGRIYVHTTEKLYCFGAPGPGVAEVWDPAAPAPGDLTGVAARLQIVPGDVLLRPGDSVPLVARVLDAKGNTLTASAAGVEWSCSPTLDLDFGGAAGEGSPAETLLVPEDARHGVGLMQAAVSGLVGSARVRVVPAEDYSEDFEGFELTEKEGETAFAHPPGFWLGGRLKWDVREIDGGKALAKTLHTPLFQRALTFLGHPAAADYTMQVDIRTEGNRRTLSSAGVIHQRYLIQLKGNYSQLEISSNVERIKETADFDMKPDVWYTLRSSVDANDDGSGMVRAKVWPRDEPEPAEWTLEVPLENVHKQGAPGLFGFSPQSRFRVYVDNIRVTSND